MPASKTTFSISALFSGEEPCQFFQELVWPNRTHTTAPAPLIAPLYQAWVDNGAAFVCFGNHVLGPSNLHPSIQVQEKIKQRSIKCMFQVQENITQRSSRVG